MFSKLCPIKSTVDNLLPSTSAKPNRHTSTRIAEHIGISVRTGELLISPPYSTIRDHALQVGHDTNANCFKLSIRQKSTVL